jgi:hypothetical protein
MRVQCKTCGTVISLPSGADPHATTWCGCCTERHHHGRAAEACPQEHDGPCWNPPVIGILLELQPDAVPIRPAGCTVCRPVAHYAVAGSPI